MRPPGRAGGRGRSVGDAPTVAGIEGACTPVAGGGPFRPVRYMLEQMKYELQTIPIWNAYNSGEDCPLCHLEESLEADYQRFFLGNSVMAPDMRIEVNAKGFCRQHYRLLYRGENKLGLALMAQTRLEERRRTFTGVMRTAGNAAAGSRGLADSLRRLLRRLTGSAGRASTAGAPPAHAAAGAGHHQTLGRDKRSLDRAAEEIAEGNRSCVICERLDRSLANYAFSILTLYRQNPEFQKTFRESRGFCFHHLPLVLHMSEIVLSGDERRQWTEDLVAAEEASLVSLGSEIEALTNSYDYRSTEPPSRELKESLPRTLGKLGGKL
mgnify:CR=1 FL=1